MKKCILILLSLFTFSGFAFAKSPDDINQTVKQAIATFMQENKVPGVAILLYVDGKPYTYYAGYANPQKKSPVNQKTIFELGSISKVMTSILLAEQVDAAKMQLDNSVTQYLPTLPASFEDMTLMNLATHTAGLPFIVPDTIKTRPEMISYLEKSSLPFPTDEEWIYSNVSIGILGYALEASTHKDFNTLLRTQLLSPLGMQAIGTDVPAKLNVFYAQGYDAQDKPVKAIQPWVFPAASAVKASAGDMQHFLSAAIGLPGTPERVLYPMRLTQAGYIQLQGRVQGLGWQIHSLAPDNIHALLDEPLWMNRGPILIEDIIEKPAYDPNTLIDKTGGTDGFRSYIAVIPGKKSGIVILANKFVPNKPLVETGREILLKLTDLMPQATET